MSHGEHCVVQTWAHDVSLHDASAAGLRRAYTAVAKTNTASRTEVIMGAWIGWGMRTAIAALPRLSALAHARGQGRSPKCNGGTYA